MLDSDYEKPGYNMEQAAEYKSVMKEAADLKQGQIQNDNGNNNGTSNANKPEDPSSDTEEKDTSKVSEAKDPQMQVSDATEKSEIGSQDKSESKEGGSN